MTFSGLLLVTLYLIGVYTNFSIYSGGQLVFPAILCAFSGAWLLLKNLSRITQDHVRVIGAMIFVALLSIVFSPGLSRYLIELVKSYLQFTLALIWSYSLYLELTRWTRGQLQNYFLAACVLLLTGCVLELTTPLREVSDSFRNVAYKGAFIYDFSERDVQLFGGIRPNLFSQEPSHIAKFFLVASTFYLAFSSSRFRYLIYLILNATAFVLVRSTTQFAFIFVGMSVVIFLNPVDSKSTAKMILRVFSITVVVTLLTIIAALSSRERVDMITQGKDASTFQRLNGPVIIVLETFQKHPLFGAGIGGYEVIEKIIIDVFLTYSEKSLIPENVSRIIANAFCNFLIFFGIFGSILFMITLVNLGKKLGGGHVLFFLSNWLIQMNIDGSFVGARVWSYCFMFLVMGYVYTTSNPQSSSQARYSASSAGESSRKSLARGLRVGNLQLLLSRMVTVQSEYGTHFAGFSWQSLANQR